MPQLDKCLKVDIIILQEEELIVKEIDKDKIGNEKENKEFPLKKQEIL